MMNLGVAPMQLACTNLFLSFLSSLTYVFENLHLGRAHFPTALVIGGISVLGAFLGSLFVTKSILAFGQKSYVFFAFGAVATCSVANFALSKLVSLPAVLSIVLPAILAVPVLFTISSSPGAQPVEDSSDEEDDGGYLTSGQTGEINPVRLRWLTTIRKIRMYQHHQKLNRRSTSVWALLNHCGILVLMYYTVMRLMPIGYTFSTNSGLQSYVNNMVTFKNANGHASNLAQVTTLDDVALYSEALTKQLLSKQTYHDANQALPAAGLG